MKKLTYTLIVLCFSGALTAFSQDCLTVPVHIRTHRPGMPATLEQAAMEAAYSPAAPGYWSYDSSSYFQWTGPTAAWYLYEKYYVTYNIAGSMTEGLYVNYDSTTGQWVNFTRYLNAYSASNTVLYRSGQVWNLLTSGWEDFTLTHYDGQGRVDENFYKTFNRVTNRFISGSRSLYTYDASGNNIEWTLQTWDTLTAGWVNGSRYTYTYSATNKLTDMVYETWNTSGLAWENSQHMEYYFDTNDFSTGYLLSVWDGSAMAWRNNMRATYTNNASGSPVERLFETWIVGPDAWQNYQYDVFQYTPEGKTLEFLTQYWNTLTAGWENYRKVTYTYHPNGNAQAQIEVQWNPIQSSWMDTYLYSTDSSGYILEYYSKIIDYNTYLYSSGYRYIYEYGENHQVLSTLQQQLDPSLNDWYDASRRLDSYDAAGNRTVELDQNWNLTGSTWENTFKMEHHFSEHLGLPEPGPLNDICYFANPMRKGGTLRCGNLDPSKQYSLVFISMNGQQVFSATIMANDQVNVPSGLASGIYILRIMEKGIIISSGKVVIAD